MSDSAAPPQAASSPHPLLLAMRTMMLDMASTIGFVALYAATKSVDLSIGFAMTLGVGQIAWQKYRGAPVETLQWASLFLVVVFGGASLITQNLLFIMCKPTIIYAAIGIVMLQRGWMLRFIPPVAQENAADLMVLFGYVWSALMFATAGINLALVLLASNAVWSWFIAVFPIASKIVLIGLQYTLMRNIVRRRIRRRKAVAMRVA